MREIVLDTETTGLNPANGDRIVEIGALELINHLPTGKQFHKYVNPQRDMPTEAFAVHGLSQEFLSDKPLFADIAGEFEEFIQEDTLIIHNAPFDMKFLNAELINISRVPLNFNRVIDSLKLARKKHPAGPNSLDALCRRYKIDISMRDIHGALLDSQLLAGVYLELIGGRQTSLTLATNETTNVVETVAKSKYQKVRPYPLRFRLTQEEICAHEKLVKSFKTSSLWDKMR